MLVVHVHLVLGSDLLMQYVGIDLSLTSTGLAIYRPTVSDVPETGTVISKPSPGKNPYEAKLDRFQFITRRILHKFVDDDETRVFLEGPSYGSAGQATHDIAGNWWLLYEALTYDGCFITVVPPAVVKMYATGKGNASKDAVLAAAIKRYPDIDIPGNDIADAVILMAIGCRLAGRPLEYQLPATHLRALDKLAKP